jgi:NADH:ubiquinone oxidoreductase subunit 5 (subunit L)/multisubunit Na+/H+ antiporter MnhA subunit
VQANKSALKAMFINRIGDFFLLIATVYIYIVFGSVDFLTVFSLVPFYQKSVISFLGLQVNAVFFITILLFVAAVGKSAQIFLHTWLPDAMEGPTPVSALIHAATMVTAGVFLILRTSFIFQYGGLLSNQILLWFGLATIFLSSVVGCVQFDIKKIIAYSTCSQLGYMVLSCGLSEYAIAFYHLVNHAFFKAVLFLAAGAVIHSLANEQDIRKMGGLLHVLPITYVVFLIGSFSLSGFPLLSGFFSKDPIILNVFCFASLENLAIY